MFATRPSARDGLTSYDSQGVAGSLASMVLDARGPTSLEFHSNIFFVTCAQSIDYPNALLLHLVTVEPRLLNRVSVD